ncbi:MAG: 4-alpha-glucanotransferase, partial [Catalinimonas sp.]
PGLFKLDAEGRPRVVSGVPPDYFSETGQLWNTPVFDWRACKETDYRWWNDRLVRNFELFDLIRLDHFRAFSAYWEVPAGHETAAGGRWVKSPGKAFFRQLLKQHPDMQIVAEDLGDIDAPVRKLMARFDLPGMRVLHFAFGDDMPQGLYIPHHHDVNSVVYTGTHDNNTTRGWYEAADADTRKRLQAYAGRRVTKANVHEVLMRLALGSVGQLAIFPMQDALGLGEEAIMNRPSVAEGNWAWRLREEQLTPKVSRFVRELTATYGRRPQPTTKVPQEKPGGAAEGVAD